MRFFFACSFALVAGCGSNGLSTNANTDQAMPSDLSMPPVVDMAINPATEDFATPFDLAMSVSDFAGVACGPQTCSGGMSCCVMLQNKMTTAMCMDSCPDGNFDVGCDGPEDCMGNPCCVGIAKGMISGAGAQCTNMPTACVPMIDLQTQTGMDRLCHVDSDCTNGAPNAQLQTCCTVMQSGVKAHICLTALFAQVVGGTCP